MRTQYRTIVTALLAICLALSGYMVTSHATGVAAKNTDPVNGAAFTTTNPGVDNDANTGLPQLCLNDPNHTNFTPAINCNIYTGKSFVWMSGGPAKASLSDGTYFFAVLDPGSQANPNDGSPGNLSDTTSAPWPNGSTNADDSAIPSGDSYANRTFTMTNGVISNYSGNHSFVNNEIRLMPYDDTTNPGGVYIMAICSLANGYPVDPSSCKYDAFKVVTGTPCTQSCGPPPDAVGLTITKDAAGADTRTYTWAIGKTVDHTNVTDGSGQHTFNYTVTVTPDDGTVSDVTVTGTIQVFNPNVDAGNNLVPVKIDGVTDQLSDSTVCDVADGGAQTLTQFETDFTYTCSLSGLPQGELDNTATVNWSTQDLSDGASLTGGSANFLFKNIAFDETPVDDCVQVTDPLAPNNGDLGTACVGGNLTFPYEYTVTGTPGACVNQDNTATFTTNDTGATDSASQTVTLCTPVDLKVTKTADTSYTRTYNWSIKKNVDNAKVTDSLGHHTFNYTVDVNQTGFTDSAIQATGTITVQNPNNFEDITGVDVSDAVDNGGSCTITDPHSGLTVHESDHIVLNYTCTYAPGTLPADGTNTATATWDNSSVKTPSGTADGSADVNFGAPASTVNQTITPTDAFDGGTGVNLCTLDVSNPPCTLTASDDASALTSQSYSYSRMVTGTPGTCVSKDNTATITNDVSGALGSDSQEVTLCTPVDLTVSKTVSTSYTRTYTWSINKSVDKTLIELASGLATFHYTVNVKQTGFTDSAIQATGTITVTNPNDFEGITVTGVTDAVDNGGSCTVTGGNTSTVVSASSHIDLNYSCTYPSGTLPSDGTNTATATWDQSAANTPDGSSFGTAAVHFGAPASTVNKTITPTDAFNGGSGVNLCTLDTSHPPCTLAASDPPAAPTSQTYTYARSIAVTADTCTNYTNTAVTGLNGDGQSSSQTVTVCGPASGGLTMGFWQNKNGQGIITGSGPSTGTCAITPWLRAFNPGPFKDLPATANCAAVGTYVTTIIKAATCSGPASAPCNTMLKAQMLSTALDVYFSSTAGGDKIKGFNGGNSVSLGGVKVDLTKVCQMTDGSGGGTCGGTSENAGSAFGAPPNSTCQTVNDLLTYAASQSAANGTPWYGTSKALQVLAKDTFDSINNGVAITCP